MLTKNSCVQLRRFSFESSEKSACKSCWPPQPFSYTYRVIGVSEYGDDQHPATEIECVRCGDHRHIYNEYLDELYVQDHV